MDSLATENLFLFEFLVDNVKMDSKCECDSPPGQHCVSFKFLDNDPLDVCEEDFANGAEPGKDENVKNGKSCLFSLIPEQVKTCMEVFDVQITVYKKMQPGWLPDKIRIGAALVSITNLFAELVESVEAQSELAPTAKTLKDTFDLKDDDGSNVGKISIYIRMSCFGKLIVTQFQMNLEDKSVLFKDKGGQSLYRYKKAGMDEPAGNSGYWNPPGTPNEMYAPQMGDQLPQFCSPPGFGGPPMQGPGFGGPPMQGAGGFGGPPMQGPPFGFGGPPMQGPQYMPPPNPTCPQTPCYPDQNMFGGAGGTDMGMYNQSPCNECMMMFNQQQQPDPMPNQFLTPCEECGTMLQPRFNQEDVPSPPPDPPGNYQEIGASMGGNSLTIRVHKDKNKVEQVYGSESDTCTCTADSVGGKKAARRELPCTPASQAFDLSPGVQQGGKNLPFSLKMGGAGAAPNNNVIVNPAVCTKPDGTKCVEISDPNKETFVLRIGKKSEGLQKKANLELELCTPRGPELKPIPKKETREIQYDPNDCEPGGAKGKKGKGKKGKDSKKGKGGKGKKGKKKK